MRKTGLTLHTPPPWPSELAVPGEKVLVIGRWFFLVESKSEDGYYAVDLEPALDVTDGDYLSPGCTCRSGETRGTCRHVTAIRAALDVD